MGRHLRSAVADTFTRTGVDSSGISPGRSTLRNEPAEARTVPCQDPIKRVDDGRESYRAKGAAQRPSEADLFEEHHSSTLVPTDYGPITEYDPPTLPPLVLRHRGQQVPGLFIAERKQRQFLVAI